jgi:hypothetical protein
VLNDLFDKPSSKGRLFDKAKIRVSDPLILMNNLLVIFGKHISKAESEKSIFSIIKSVSLHLKNNKTERIINLIFIK